jgi:murein DD-endopeptidase MepM/ murein hydrolase activator NlpD
MRSPPGTVDANRMTRTGRTFPARLRLLATACAVMLLAVVATTASADPSQDDVDAAEETFEQTKARLAAQQAEIAAIEARAAQAAFEVDRLEGEIEQISVELATVRERIDKARARFETVRERLNERTAEAFMAGPTTNLDVIFGATSMADLSDRLEFVDAVTASDAELAQEVANLEYELEQDELRLADLRQAQKDKLAEAESVEAGILADLDRAEQLRAQYAADSAAAYDRWQKATKELKEFLAEQRAQSPPHGNVPLPAEWRGLFEVCPVDTPRAFGDGFGAPRYVGGYHLHKGVDIVAPEGTPVRATFDGVARDTTNSLGGIAVAVAGRYGETYNAHLQSIAKLGPVRAGDVIGYVSSTGLAGGSTPHNHFEFHPYVIPSGWPASYYGYSVISDAINPYPLLVDACG